MLKSTHVRSKRNSPIRELLQYSKCLKDLFLDSSYVPTNPNDPEEKYKVGTNFSELYSMFLFDRKLREIFLKYFLIVENHFKTLVSYEFSILYGEDGYLDIKNFNFTSKKSLDVIELQKMIHSTISKNKNTDRIKHFYNKPKTIPIWSLVSFFEISKIRQFYTNCQPIMQNKVALYYNLNINTLISFISAINMFRNVCAHDNRLYCYKLNDSNKQISDTRVHYNMQINTIKRDNKTYFVSGKNDLFAIVIALKYLLADSFFIEFANELIKAINNLKTQIKTITINDVLHKMGFPLYDNNTGQKNWTDIVNVSKF